MKYLTDVLKGNANSGNYGHAGRPGIRGGSVAGGGGGGGGFVPELSEASKHMLAASKNPNLVQSNMNLGGGIGSTKLVQIKDDGKVIYKPDSENTYRINEAENRVATQRELEIARADGYEADYPRVRHTITNEKIPPSARERAAYEIDRAMDLNVTPSVEVVEFNKGKGSGMEYIEGQAAAKYFGGADRRTDAEMKVFEDHPDVESIALLDFTIGNTDRHAGNFRRETGTGRWRAIDNGLSFPDKGNGQYRSVPGGHLASKGINISPRAKNAIAKLEPNLNRIMKRNGFGLKAIKAVRARLDILKTAYTWSDARRMLVADNNKHLK